MLPSLILWVLGVLLAGDALVAAYLVSKASDPRILHREVELTAVLSAMMLGGIGLFILGFYV